jgi:hypothetical protein
MGARVDYDPNPFDSEAGLGDGGRKHDLAAPLRIGMNRRGLLVKGEIPIERHDDGIEP